MDSVDVASFEEFEQWASGKARQTRYHYKSSLQKFCELHGRNPRELIAEARKGLEEDSEAPWLEENAAEQRLKEFYSHLVTPGEEGGRGVSRNSAATYFRHIKSFYSKFGCSVDVKTPSADVADERPELESADVRKLVSAAPGLRDRAIILCAFQGGMGPTEICRLDYGQVENGLDNGDCPLRINKVRKKSKVSHDTWIGRDAIEALKAYLNEREGKEEELDSEDPLFVKRGKKGEEGRMTPNLIQRVMREVRDTCGGEIEEVEDKLEKSSQNPLSLRYLRKAFGDTCDEQKIGERYKEYWMGHAPPYRGAYNGGLSREKQREEYRRLERALSITAATEDMDNRIERLQQRLGERGERIGKLEERMEGLEKELKEIKDLRKKELKVARAFADLEDEDVEQMFDFASKLYDLARKDPEVREKVREKS